MLLWNNITYKQAKIILVWWEKTNHLKLEHLMIMCSVPSPTVSDVGYHKLTELQFLIYR